MTVGVYTIVSGTVLNEQSLVTQLNSFMVNTLGWQLLDVVTDTGADNDRVWKSRGEAPGKYRDMYVRTRGNADIVSFFGYSYWYEATNTGSGTINDATETRIAGPGTLDYWFVGNKDAVYISVYSSTNAVPYMGGFGYWDTYYTPQEDNLPLFIMGQNASTDSFSSTGRVWSYAPPVLTTVSGQISSYYSIDIDILCQAGAPNARDNRYAILKPVFYSPASVAYDTREVRGELPGLYQMYGDVVGHGNVITVSGVSPGFGLGKFFIYKRDSAITYLVGPVVTP